MRDCNCCSKAFIRTGHKVYNATAAVSAAVAVALRVAYVVRSGFDRSSEY